MPACECSSSSSGSRPVVLDRVAEAVQRADARVPAPREDELARAARADQLVVDRRRASSARASARAGRWRTSSCPAACGIRCVKPSSATVCPSATSEPTASPRLRISATPAFALLEREGVGAALDGDPAELGELVDDGLAAEAPEARVLDSAERHLRLVADRLVVDVDDPRLDLLGEREAAVRVRR